MDWEPRVGMRVVFIGGCTHGYSRKFFFGMFKRWVGVGTLLKVGAVYEISQVCWGRHRITGREQVGITLVNDPDPRQNGAYATHHFRPLDERRLDVFREMLAPTPKQPVRSDA
jgi:hypothetical protein